MDDTDHDLIFSVLHFGSLKFFQILSEMIHHDLLVLMCK
jgi:hypothetical protein